MKRIILCADDYGQNPAISQAIVELLKEQRLSATTCMTSSPLWNKQAKWLKDIPRTFDIGLHFNLTDGEPLSKGLKSFYPLGKLFQNAILHRLSVNDVVTELNAQLDEFETFFGELPDCIDGHKHIHQFPIIRDAILHVYQQRFKNKKIYIRSTYVANSWLRFNDVAYIKQLAIQLTGARKFNALLNANSISHNSSFSGIYNFNHSLQYQTYFQKFLHQIETRGMIMCHPGLLPLGEENDLIAVSRHNEYQYFSSEKFLDDCQKNNIVLSRFKDL